jgi:hypothetical protein
MVSPHLFRQTLISFSLEGFVLSATDSIDGF